MHTRRSQLLAIATMLALAPTIHLAWAGAAERPAGAPLTRAATKPNGSGIDVSYRLEGEPATGQATRIVLVLSGVSDPDNASVRFAADADLKLEGDTGAPRRLTPGQAASFSLTVVPQADGLRYLNVFTTQHGVTSATSIAVQAGRPAAPLPSGKLQSTPKGDNILSMPVK